MRINHLVTNLSFLNSCRILSQNGEWEMDVFECADERVWFIFYVLMHVLFFGLVFTDTTIVDWCLPILLRLRIHDLYTYCECLRALWLIDWSCDWLVVRLIDLFIYWFASTTVIQLSDYEWQLPGIGNPGLGSKFLRRGGMNPSCGFGSRPWRVLCAHIISFLWAHVLFITN